MLRFFKLASLGNLLTFEQAGLKNTVVVVERWSGTRAREEAGFLWHDVPVQGCYV